MKQFDLKAHNQKTRAFTKRVMAGDYPSKRLARNGSYVGLGIGALLIVTSIALCIAGITWVGALIGGILTVGSNIINLRRIAARS